MIYFDESGYTGNNLLSPDQPAFIYTSVAIDPSYASRLHSEMLSHFHIQAKELKGKNLVRSVRGREAISWLLNLFEACWILPLFGIVETIAEVKTNALTDCDNLLQ